MRIFKNLLLSMAVVSCLTGCGTLRPYVMNQTADALSGQASDDENDLQLAKDASAFYLKFSESVLREVPEHQGLRAALAAGYTQYAFAFVSFEAEQMEHRDREKAAQLRERAGKLYARAHAHAMRALKASYPRIEEALQTPDASQWPELSVAQVRLVYWASASLGGWISMSKDSPEAVANLPLAHRLAEWAWRVDPGFQQGALSSLMATYETARIGGSTDKAASFIDQAIQASGGESAGPWVTQAEVLAVAQHDKEMFTHSLKQACEIATARPSLSNEVMCVRARWLLTQMDELF